MYRIFLFLFLLNGILSTPVKHEKLAFPPAATKNENPAKKVDTVNCGYKSCHPTKDGMINVHIVAHTHDDVGWLKTVDQYYFGSKTTIQNAGVENILDSVIDSLKKDKNRRFIYVETAFFWKWWMRQHDTVKSVVRKLVANGQLEFIGGAWSMNDEATTHYQSIIDQFTWGLRKLNETFGECGQPKIGWQIDPFGHSREMASIFAQLGFDGVLLGRIDYQDKSLRMKTKTPEMIWKSSDNLEGKNSEIFTGVMYNTYSPPKGFCFDILCSDESIIDDKKSPEYNVDGRVNDFFDYLKKVTDGYASNNVIITMGEDFNYQDAHVWFKNLDKLIKYANEKQVNGSKYNLLYSTPSCYVKAIHEESEKKKMKWPVKSDDFFPYASDPNSFWTGFFTSRPTIKRFEREGNNYLQVCKQLYSLSGMNSTDWADLNTMREAMGVLQHHDAVTGTEKEHVAKDYARILQHGFDECDIVTNTALKKLMKLDNEKDVSFKSCLLLNTSSCATSETEEKFLVTIYNPLTRPITKFVRLPVKGKAYTVSSKNGSLETQIIPISSPIINIPGRMSKASNELIFRAVDVPALGYNTYEVKLNPKEDKVLRPKEKHSFEESGARFTIDDKTGLLTDIVIDGVSIPITQEFLYYKGFVGDNKVFKNRSSGAYIFRPKGSNIYRVADKVKHKFFSGSLVTEVHQIFNEWVSQIIRIYKGESYVEFDWLVGPIPKDVNGKEVITRFKTNLKNDGIFYTDSNGREMLKRIRNFRPTWKLTLDEPISGNYYPVTSKILIQDYKADLELAVLNDRAQGGSSLKDGQIELMVHRNCMHDDAFGVGEALDEQAFGTGLVARGTHWVVIGSLKNKTNGKSVAAIERDIAQRKLLSAWTFLTPLSHSTKDIKQTFTGLNHNLPDNVQILTLEPWHGTSYLLRLEHVLEKNEDPNLFQAVSVDLKNLFTTFEVTSMRETTLGGNKWLTDSKRLEFHAGEKLENLVAKKNTLDSEELENRRKWTDKQTDSLNHVKRSITTPIKTNTISKAKDDGLVISLSPMQIRTFVINVRLDKSLTMPPHKTATKTRSKPVKYYIG